MKKETIEQLLERYWKCESSLEEEKQLLEFFSGKNVPEELKKYIPLFQLKNKQKEIKAQTSFIIPYKEEKKLKLYPFLKIAASFLIVLTLGIGVYTHYQQEKFLDVLFSETYTESEDAIKRTGEIVAKVSSLLQLVPEFVISEEEDSIEGEDFINKFRTMNDSVK